MPKVVSVSAPGSIANIGCLFDAGGMAVKGFRDRVTVRVGGEGIRVTAVGDVPSGEGNVAYAVARSFMAEMGLRSGVHIEVVKGVPVSAGLGSSGATAAATAAALNIAFEAGLGLKDVLRLAASGEAFAAGEPHYDNVAPSLLGGVVLVNPASPGELLRLDPPPWLRVVLFLRQGGAASGKTRAMRGILPQSIQLKRMTEQVFAAALFTWGLLTGEEKGIGYASRGGVVEEVRARYVENYWEAKRVAIEAGALAFNISGAGPSLFALVREGEEEEVVKAVQQLLRGYSVATTSVDTRGVAVEN